MLNCCIWASPSVPVLLLPNNYLFSTYLYLLVWEDIWYIHNVYFKNLKFKNSMHTKTSFLVFKKYMYSCIFWFKLDFCADSILHEYNSSSLPKTGIESFKVLWRIIWHHVFSFNLEIIFAYCKFQSNRYISAIICFCEHKKHLGQKLNIFKVKTFIC